MRTDELSQMLLASDSSRDAYRRAAAAATRSRRRLAAKMRFSYSDYATIRSLLFFGERRPKYGEVCKKAKRRFRAFADLRV